MATSFFQRAGALLLCLCGSACGSAAPALRPAAAVAHVAAPPVAATPANDGAALWRQVQAEVGDGQCDAPQQCRSSPVGSKACGGPSAYLAWSIRRSDAGRLASLLEQHAAVRGAEDRDSGMMSTCAVVSDPGATCSAGRCVLRPRGLGGSEAR